MGTANEKIEQLGAELEELVVGTMRSVAAKLSEGARRLEKVKEQQIHEYEKKLGSEKGREFYALEEEVWRAKAKWEEYKILFVEARVESGATIATGFSFWLHMGRVLFEDIVLHLARLTDGCPQRVKLERQAGGFRNKETRLGIGSTIGMCSEIPETRARLERKIKDACEAVKNIRKWRDMWLAHNDKNTRNAGKRRHTLPEVTHEEIEEALKKINEVLNIIRAERLNKATTSEVLVGNGGENSRIVTGNISLMIGVVGRLGRMLAIGPENFDAQKSVEILKRISNADEKELYDMVCSVHEINEGFGGQRQMNKRQSEKTGQSSGS